MFSMTGYGSAKADGDWGTMTMGITSVNHRYQEITVKLPREFSWWEPWFHRKIRSAFSRGKVSCRLDVAWSGRCGSNMINRDFLMALYRDVASMASDMGAPPVDLGYLLGVSGVLDGRSAVMDEDALEEIFSDLINRAVEDWNASRRAEGEFLWGEVMGKISVYEGIIDDLSSAWGEARDRAFEHAKERVSAMLKDMGLDLDESRWAQELVLMADRWDVEEELSRIRSHLLQFRQVTSKEGPWGKRLDFIIQELNRETNTIGSKVNDAVLRSMVVDAKTALEMVREQIQNLE
ncbi:TIGR00255 family protein [Thermanaerovibrio velox DSM 12556]|uniref:TIGR00255 family protein n=2 Tax=Thermanaerovibrio TaxID=81461 RepID=H0US48_9BACT|nr:TIGR00255 family protein [Thermanaerovibrio velox DSM 12556]